MAKPTPDEDSTLKRLKTWGRLAGRPEAWPLEFLFVYSLAVLGKLFLEPDPPMEKLTWALNAFAGVMTNPFVLIFMVPFAVLLFQRGVRKVVQADKEARAEEQRIRGQAIIDVKNLIAEATKLANLMALEGRALRRAQEADEAIKGLANDVKVLRQFGETPREGLVRSDFDRSPLWGDSCQRRQDRFLTLERALPEFQEAPPELSRVHPKLTRIAGNIEAMIDPAENADFYRCHVQAADSISEYIQKAIPFVHAVRQEELTLQKLVKQERERLYGTGK